jgi:hypothetical protein
VDLCEQPATLFRQFVNVQIVLVGAVKEFGAERVIPVNEKSHGHDPPTRLLCVVRRSCLLKTCNGTLTNPKG